MIKQINQHGDNRHTFTSFHAEVKKHVAPKVKRTFKSGGIRYYEDIKGGIHLADVVDKVFTPQVLKVKGKGFKGDNPCKRLAVLQ